MSESRCPELPGFGPHDLARWRSLCETPPGARPLESLASRTVEGIGLRPLYRGHELRGLPHLGTWPGQPPYLRGRSALPSPAEVRSEPIAVDPLAWNQLAREEVRGGVRSLSLPLGEGRVPIATREGLGAAIDGIDLTENELVLELGDEPTPLAAFDLLAPVLGAGARICLGFDPIARALDGAARGEAGLDAVVELASRCQQRPELARLRVAAIDGSYYAEAGGHSIQELAFSLAAGVELFRACLARGLEVEALARRLELRLGVGPRFFTEIAKLRAARRLWDAVAGSFGAATRSVPIVARPTRFLLSGLDAPTNMIRVAIACSAALSAGADTIVAQPFDEPLGEPDALSRRIARNQPAILVEEAHLRRVVDPAGGAYFVEWLTGELAREAWSLFQTVEARGGMLATVRDGFVLTELARARAERIARIARRADGLVGVSQYANPGEGLPRGARRERPRIGAAFEALRELADRHRERTGAAPRALVLRAGPAAKLRARVEYARGVLEAGGFLCDELCCEPALEACTAALRGAPPDDATAPVVLCALDAELPVLAGPLAARLAGAVPPRTLTVAARPPDQSEWTRVVEGSGGFVHLGADLPAVLRRLHGEVRP